jgi:hypothetical protein
MMDKWIENQAKALADYASIKYQGPYLYSEAHDLLRLYAESCLKEAQERVMGDAMVAVPKDLIDNVNILLRSIDNAFKKDDRYGAEWQAVDDSCDLVQESLDMLAPQEKK